MKISQTIARPKQFLAGILIAVALLAGTPARPVAAIATTRYVNGATGADSGDCIGSPCLTIGYAISQSVDNNIIQIAAGTYPERITVNHNISFVGAGVDSTVLDGGGGGRVVEIITGKVVLLKSLTIQNGNAGSDAGGGIDNHGTLSLANVKVVNNTAEFGGGIASDYMLAITDSIITGNHATTDSYGFGGGLALTGTNGEVSLTGVTISNNTASNYSGGIHDQIDNSVSGSLTLTNVTISGNTAQQAGAMANTNHAITRVINSTIADNHYSAGGGNGGIANYATISFINTIIAGNQGFNCGLGSGGAWTSLGNNLDSRNDCAFSAPGDLHDSDPLLETLTDNGGPTPTMALGAGSPAINAGHDATCIAAVGAPGYGADGVDQRGVARPQGSYCDIGAFELMVLGAFSKTAPANAAFVTTTPTLSWGASSGASDYEVCFDTINNNACDASWSSTGGSTVLGIGTLPNNSTYYWQVRAVNGDGTVLADGGAWWSFTARNQRFADVPIDHPFWAYIEAMYTSGITTGCGTGPLIFCPDNPVTRAAMAVFLLRAEHGSSYAPPAGTHTFADLPVAGKEWQEAWVNQFYLEGITTGCGTGPLIYCPENPVTRAAMAVFILRAKYGSSYTPPAASHFFSDLPVAGKEWMEPWVDELYREGITTGCGTGPLIYCPETAVKRQAMAAFITRAFSLPMP
jgi:hypothetical protein